MNDPLPPLQIRIFGIDGSTRTFTENDLRVTTHVLAKLNPAKFFADDTVNIISGDSEFTLSAAGLARIELITDRLSVWDFPFIMGAHIELTEDEFRECLDYAQQRETADRLSDLPVFVEVTMVKGQRYHFWMEVVGGLSNLRVSRIHSLLKGGHLIFGLRNGGVGVLNLAYMTHFSIYPAPPDAAAEAQAIGYKLERNELGLSEFQNCRSEQESPVLVGEDDMD